jgi:c(7)-type cytochrome triheme protein
LFFSSILVVMGFIINRLNVSITGMMHSETYFPKWTELAITVGLVVFGFVVFALAVKHLNIFPPGELPEAPEKVKPIFTGNLVLVMWCLLIIGVVTYALTKNASSEAAAEPAEQGFVRVVDVGDNEPVLPDDIVYAECTEENDCPGPVIFSHESHFYVQDEPNCSVCHSGMFSMNTEGRSAPVRLLMESMYEGENCGSCHNGNDAFSAEECDICHMSE